MSFTALFLLVFAAAYFRLTSIQALVLLAGYVGFTALDQWYRRRKRQKTIEYELVGWKVSAEDPEYEEKGNLSRRKLTGENRIIVTRVVEAVERML